MDSRPVTDLQDLIERPVESEGLELKSWVDLANPSARAGIARHLAAIANFGGGYLIFGFNNDTTRCAPNNDVRSSYSQDVIAGIVDRYLQPKFQCEVIFESFANVEHAVIWIPSHGETPIISKASGPHDPKGQPQGIRSGTIYIRTPKPESVPATTPEHFAMLIQRCVLARRDELVRMFSAIVSSGIAPSSSQLDRNRDRERLSEWHNATQKAFVEEMKKAGHAHRIPAIENFVQLSYLIKDKKEAQIPVHEFLKAVERMNRAVRDTVRYGWSMFYPFTRPEIQPRFMTDTSVDDGETDFLQTNLIENGESDHLDFWRISPDGRASLIRSYHEDRFTPPEKIAEGGKWFDPWLQVRDITELVRHARAYAEELPEVEEICFEIEWKGLRSRTTATANSERYVTPHVSQTDQRVVFLPVPYAEAIGDLPGVVSKLYAPVHRLFDPHFNVTAEWVSRSMPDFIVVGL